MLIITRHIFVILIATLAFYVFILTFTNSFSYKKEFEKKEETKNNSAFVIALPEKILLSSGYHVSQTFNNCAPAALSIALSYYDISVSQEILAKSLRPFNNLRGIDDDKSTPPQELAEEAEKYGLISYFRAGGDIETLKKILASGQPIIIRTLLNTNEDYAHYRVIRGYDERTKEIIQDDSYQGKDIRYTYEEFNKIWKPFNYAYLVIVKPEKKAEIEQVLGENLDPRLSWRKSRTIAKEQLMKNPGDTMARFNLSIAHYYLGNYKGATMELEKIGATLPRHTLWYQMEPIEAYFQIRNYDKVFKLTDGILNDKNKAYSELYILRGKSYMELQQSNLARAEFEKAVFYNINSKTAREALASLLGQTN